VLWTEWVDIDDRAWTDDDFRRAGRLLGQLAARRREGQPINDRLPALDQQGPNFGMHHYVQNRVIRGIGADLADDRIWQHPRLQAACGGDAETLRADMRALIDRIPMLMAELDSMPQTQPHGDASPQNLLLSAAEPGTVIVTDWGFGGFHSVGMDLSQLLVGLAHAGLLDPGTIPGLLELVVDAYTDGLADGGWPQPRELVHRGALLTVLCRSALTALPFAELDVGTDADLAARVALTRVLIGLRTGPADTD